ncbi:MAG: RNA 2',3'-cyclic phosphodiesterase [candidate division WOR-3 bacterium]|nr:RNA 2',3'-cyclic phosphodiesterase [candidate division WOR-3 bacterium]
MRVFFGIGLPPDIRKQVNSFLEALRTRLPRMKWVEEKNLHVTLRFLGEIEETKVPLVCAAARETASGLEGFRMALGSLGAFPDPRRARVLWWGLSQGAEESGQLFDRLEQRLVAQGIEAEKRRYHPHLTLARLRYPAPLPLESFSTPSALSFTASSFTLYQSTLTPNGPIYKIVEEFKLG